ncbi:MAG: glycoside hydrolase family 57 protein [Candidatus Omnitrophota bacterium]|nr:glycoside hydrolase family 57 protein [Candidatus Omnitrophota bacterium]
MDTKKTLGVAFLWHMHQPYYKDPIADKYMMPWVRLRGVKDYYPMAALVDKFDGVKVTFNLVPSLVEQINDYVHKGATDISLDMTAKPASSLTFRERVYLLNNFFHVNFKRFIEPNARYAELLIKKGVRPLMLAALKDVVKSFSDRDILDLQVLFNMAWFHSISVDSDVNLKELIEKSKGYTESDKAYVLAKQKEIMGGIIPLYKKLREEGKAEITTTPFYHPILPLLCDTSVADISSPGMELPKKFSHPEDAAWHIKEAVEYHEKTFGAPPEGMWPSEGSVSDKTIELAAAGGIKWLATDEDILFRTLSSYDRRCKGIEYFDRRIIYRPYKVKSPAGSMAVVFRDKNLSDMISFSYNSWNPSDAARDLIGHMNNIAQNLRRDTDRGLLTIAMDGENAWEYYEDNGRKFFETLYADIDKQEYVCSTGITGYLSVEPPKRTLSRVFPGSWINHNFEIWIGQEQDNVSWEYLAKVRRDLVKFGKGAVPDSLKLIAAWRELYIAEGSDWNWWYQGKARQDGDNPFDKLYLTHLQNVYRLLEKPIPDFLKISIA